MRIKPWYRFGIFILGLVVAIWFFRQATAEAFSRTKSVSTSLDPILGEPFTISTGTIHESASDVAYNSADGEYLVVWTNLKAVSNDIYAQRISEQGEFLSWFYVADGENPKVAYNPKNNTYLVVFFQVGQYGLRRLNHPGRSHRTSRGANTHRLQSQ
jgi:hypothetical protein